MSVLSVVVVRYRSLIRADHSSRGVLSTVVNEETPPTGGCNAKKQTSIIFYFRQFVYHHVHHHLQEITHNVEQPFSDANPVGSNSQFTYYRTSCEAFVSQHCFWFCHKEVGSAGD
jgi:hypothetical protein